MYIVYIYVYVYILLHINGVVVVRHNFQLASHGRKVGQGDEWFQFSSEFDCGVLSFIPCLFPV